MLLPLSLFGEGVVEKAQAGDGIFEEHRVPLDDLRVNLCRISAFFAVAILIVLIR
jgi:hypothetical protein